MAQRVRSLGVVIVGALVAIGSLVPAARAARGAVAAPTS
jgi:uncharacterized Ntn-hydrolase superfamily protein